MKKQHSNNKKSGKSNIYNKKYKKQLKNNKQTNKQPHTSYLITIYKYSHNLVLFDYKEPEKNENLLTPIQLLIWKRKHTNTHKIKNQQFSKFL